MPTGDAALAEARDEAFRLLARGVADRRSAFHTPTLATLDATGAPTLRTVVLRGFDAAARRLRFHADARSPKVAQLGADPRAAVHVYDAGAKLQLRLAGRASLHRDDAVAEAGWAASQPGSRLCYAIGDAPGTPVAAPPPAPTDPGEGRARFTVILFTFDRLEWLHLAHAGHRRAAFRWEGEALSAESWLVP